MFSADLFAIFKAIYRGNCTWFNLPRDLELDMVILSTVAHICKRYKQCLKCNKHFPNTTQYYLHPTLYYRSTTQCHRNTIRYYRNTTQCMETQLSICKTQRKSSKTQLYICETQHKSFRYVMQDVNTIQIINPPLLNRWHALHFPAILVRHFAWKSVLCWLHIHHISICNNTHCLWVLL